MLKLFQSVFNFFMIMLRRLFSTFLDHHITTTSDFIATNNIKTTSVLPLNLESLNWLLTAAPCFPVRGDQVKIILDPDIFYQTLITKSTAAKRRISLASLYLGTGNLEQTLVQALETNLNSNSELEVNILLDFTRGTRGEKNSKSMLIPLLKESEKCNLSLYHTPVLRGITKRLVPPRWNELVGLQHMKVYIFDDSVIISGANLSNDYFTNRQDRYVLVEDKPLADFYHKLIGKVQEFSLEVQRDEQVLLHKSWNILPYEGNRQDFVQKAKERISDYFKEIVDQQRTAFDDKKDADTWLFPLIEMGQLGVHHDSSVTKHLLSCSVEDSELKLATGYFNLTEDYMNTITNDCVAHCSILMAHPNANGFQGAKGPAGGIPAAYSLIAKNFYEKLIEAEQDYRVKFFEYEKLGWSYHAKGLWYYLPKQNLPNLTLIGSSNFGERSVNRDLETQICLVTVNKALQQGLQKEVDNLFKTSSTAEKDITSRPVPKWVQAVVKLFRNFF